MPERTLTVRIIGDDSSLQRAFARDAKAAQTYGVQVAGLGRSFLKAGIAAGATAASFQGISAVIGQSIQNASDLSEQIARTTQVFEENADSVVAWSKTTADSMGLAQSEALSFAGTFGLLFRNIGESSGDAENLSKTLVQLGADLASFNNTGVEDALLAIRSGLTGEIEPLRRFGVFLSEATTQQVALAQTGKKSADELTTQEKVLARYSIIMQQTTRAQGDFARTSEGLANQQRKLRALVKDLSAAFGSLLIPKMLETVGAINDLIGAFRRLERAIPGDQGGAAGDFFGELFKSLPAQIADQVENLQQMGEDIDFVLRNGPFAKRGPGFEEIGKIISDDIAGMAREIEGSVPVVARIAGSIGESVDKLNAALLAARQKLLKAQAIADRREAERSAKAWNEFVLGMGLKLDIAQLTEGTDNDLAALRELEAAILRRIEREGRTFKLVSQLTDTRLRINSILRSQTEDAASASSEAFSDSLAALELKLDIAETTRGFNDDMRALRAIEGQILARIRAEGRTTELLRQLFENRQAQAEKRREARNAAAFEALGLTPEGERPTPGGSALLKRARSLQEQIKGTVLDTPKTRQELRRIVSYLQNNLRTAGRDVRQAILGMLNDISSALDSGDKPQGPLTKFAKTGIGKLIAGLGLTEEQVRELRARMSAVGPGMSVPRRGTGAFGMAVPAGAQTGPARRSREDDFVFHIYIDGQEVESRVTRRQQKKQGRNGRSRRGTRPGR